MLGLILILLAAAMLAPGLVVGPSLDAAVFTHVGGRILDGTAPYIGAWDHKPPGIYLVSAAVQSVFGWLGPWTADWLLSIAATAGLGVAVASILAREGVGGRPRALVAIGVVVLAGQYLLALGGGLTEPVATALVATSLAIVMRRPGPAGLTAAGGLLGFSLLISVQVLPGVPLVMALALALQHPRSRSFGAAALVAAALVPIAAAGAWLSALGALPAAWDAVVTYSIAYRAASAGFGATLGASAAVGTILLSLYLIAPAVVGAASLATASQPRRALVVVSLLWIGGSLALFVAESRFYAHYAIPLAVPIGILAGLGLGRIAESLRRVGTSGQRILIVLPLVATLCVSVLASISSTTFQIAPVADRSERMRAVSERLRDLPSGTLLVWGNQPRLYDLAGRAPATRYIYFYPLTTPGYSTASMIEDVARALAEDPPAAVVDAGSDAPGAPGFLPLLIPRPVLTDGRNLDLLDPLRAFVAEHYELALTVAGWPVYVLRSDTIARPPSPPVAGDAPGFTVAYRLAQR